MNGGGMFGSDILDTAIGLVFVFLLVSVLVTVVNEIIAATLKSRSKWLQFGIARLIGSSWAAKLYAHPLIAGTSSKDAPTTISEDKPPKIGSGPSYITSRSFADVLIHLVVEADTWVPAFQTVAEKAIAALQNAIAATQALPLGSVGQVAAPAQAAQPVVSTPPRSNPDVEALAQAIAAEFAALGDAAAGYRTASSDLVSALRAKDASYTVGQAIADVDAFVRAMPLRYFGKLLDQLDDNDRIKKTLQLLLREVDGDVDKFKENIELWFDHAMDRVSGWYKRNAQWVTFSVGLVASIALNVDCIRIGNYLQTHASVRDAIVAKAKAYGAVTPPVAKSGDGEQAKKDSEPAEAQFKRAKDEFDQTTSLLNGLGIPIGWCADVPSLCKLADTTPGTRTDLKASSGTEDQDIANPPKAATAKRAVAPASTPIDWFGIVKLHVFGWLITALAATLGAPFWFDTLARIISIRSSGKAPEETPRAPKAQPKAAAPGDPPKS
jgi:hypothetical protein